MYKILGQDAPLIAIYFPKQVSFFYENTKYIFN